MRESNNHLDFNALSEDIQASTSPPHKKKSLFIIDLGKSATDLEVFRAEVDLILIGHLLAGQIHNQSEKKID